MALDPATAGAIQTGGSIISDIAGLFGAKKQDQRNWSRTVKQEEWAIDQWNRQNAYNHPAAQMERFNAAGLNPHLIYGKGTAGNATALPQMPRRSESQNFMKGIQAFGQFVNFRNIAAQTDLLSAQKQKEEAQASLILSSIPEVLNRISSQQMDLGIKSKLYNSTIHKGRHDSATAGYNKEIAAVNAAKAIYLNKMIKEDTDLSNLWRKDYLRDKAQANYEADKYQHGIHPNDPWQLKILKELDIDKLLQKLFRNSFK